MRAPGSEGHISLVTKLGFGSGDIFGGGALTLIGVYYLSFLTDVLRINPSLARLSFSALWFSFGFPQTFRRR